MNLCAFNTGSDIHLLDHIAPLASLLEMPLIVTEEENALLAAKYYPELIVRYYPDLEFKLKEIAEEFDTLFECKYWAPHLKQLFRSFFQKDMLCVFCPHGQSDKGFKAPLLAPYALQDAVLIYGDLMKEMLSELKVWNHISSHATVGNYRMLYHQKYRHRQLLAAQNSIFKYLNPSFKTLLYAPTWRDADESSTFFQVIHKILKEMPSNWNLIVKIHPLLEQRDPALFYSLPVEQRENCVFISDFPIVYPILERIDAYLGDYSSVGYDVLAFKKPMFFFQKSNLPSTRLHSCGKILDPAENLFQSIERELPHAMQFSTSQESLYNRAFTPVESLTTSIFSLSPR